MANKIKTYARLRPLLDDTKSGQTSYSLSAKELQLHVPLESRQQSSQNIETSYSFKFDKIFDTTARQEEVFNAIALPSIESSLAGYNSTIFAYGQTGSGKTFTITGGAERYQDRGIIPRTLEQIFRKSHDDLKIAVSYIEIYNENAYDLLDERHDIHNARKPLQNALEAFPKVQLLEDAQGNINLKNMSIHSATNEEEALSLLFLGDTNRAIAETPMNQASTRSHCIFTIHITNAGGKTNKVMKSKLHLVDLAGSERVTKTGVSGQLLNEAKYINLSLHYLEQVIVSLTSKSGDTSHIPYRNSMMTSILRDSLGGNCVTSMIATLSTAQTNAPESVSTCRFSQRVALVKNRAAVNEVVDVSVMMDRQKGEIARLKAEIQLLNGGGQRSDEVDEKEGEDLRSLVNQYAAQNGDNDKLVEIIGADTLRLDYCYRIFRDLYKSAKESMPSRVPTPVQSRLSATFTDDEIMNLRETLIQRDHEIDVLVTMLRREKRAKISGSTVSGGGDLSAKPSSLFSSPSSHAGQNVMSKINESQMKKMSVGRKEAFEQWKNGHSSSSIDTLNWQRDELKKKYAKAKSLGGRMNNYRAIINQLKGQLARADSDSYAEIQSQMEQNRVLFQETKTELSALKPQVEHEQHLHEKTKRQVLEEFNSWWENREKGFKTENPATQPSPQKTPTRPEPSYNASLYQSPTQPKLPNDKTFTVAASYRSSLTNHSTSAAQSAASFSSRTTTITPPDNVSLRTAENIQAFEQARRRIEQAKFGL